MDALTDIELELTAVVGATAITLGELTKLGRGAVLGLDTRQTDSITLSYRNRVVATGDTVIDGDRISVRVAALPAHRKR